MTTTAPLTRERLLSVPALPQGASPLFNQIPPEIRREIFSLALADFPDPSANSRYQADTCYTRPSYFSPRKTDARLLRTCRAVYSETWFLPFVMREQSHWLTGTDRAPPGHIKILHRARLSITLAQIRWQFGGEAVEIESLRAFAQMYVLERGELAILLRTPNLHPRSLTLTIRHADWWFWEDDQPLRFEGGWIREVCDVLSPSVREIHVELESVARKKDQVDSIARQMSERWFFKRTDGETLYPDITMSAVKVDRWTGSSTWHHHRWERDESRPGEIDYYIVDVVFRPMHVVQRLGGQVSPSAVEDAEKGLFQNSELKLQCKDERTNHDVSGSHTFGDQSEDEDEDEDEDDDDYEDDDEDEDEDDDEYEDEDENEDEDE